MPERESEREKEIKSENSHSIEKLNRRLKDRERIDFIICCSSPVIWAHPALEPQDDLSRQKKRSDWPRLQR